MKKLLLPENRVLLVALCVLLLSLLVSAVVIIIAANGGFSPSTDPSKESASSTLSPGEDWEDPDNKNWTNPIK